MKGIVREEIRKLVEDLKSLEEIAEGLFSVANEDEIQSQRLWSLFYQTTASAEGPCWQLLSLAIRSEIFEEVSRKLKCNK